MSNLYRFQSHNSDICHGIAFGIRGVLQLNAFISQFYVRILSHAGFL